MSRKSLSGLGNATHACYTACSAHEYALTYMPGVHEPSSDEAGLRLLMFEQSTSWPSVYDAAQPLPCRELCCELCCELLLLILSRESILRLEPHQSGGPSPALRGLVCDVKHGDAPTEVTLDEARDEASDGLRSRNSDFVMSTVSKVSRAFAMMGDESTRLLTRKLCRSIALQHGSAV